MKRKKILNIKNKFEDVINSTPFRIPVSLTVEEAEILIETLNEKLLVNDKSVLTSIKKVLNKDFGDNYTITPTMLDPESFFPKIKLINNKNSQDQFEIIIKYGST